MILSYWAGLSCLKYSFFHLVLFCFPKTVANLFFFGNQFPHCSRLKVKWKSSLLDIIYSMNSEYHIRDQNLFSVHILFSSCFLRVEYRSQCIFSFLIFCYWYFSSKVALPCSWYRTWLVLFCSYSLIPFNSTHFSSSHCLHLISSKIYLTISLLLIMSLSSVSVRTLMCNFLIGFIQ